MTPQRHTHRLVRFHPLGSPKNLYRWKCINKDCFAVFKLEYIKGKEFKCTEPGCENTYIMEYGKYRVARPKCIDHDMTKKGKSIREGLKLFEELMK